MGQESQQGAIDLAQHISAIANEPLNFETTIERTLMDLKRRFRIQKAVFDPWQMQAVSQRLYANGIHVEEFPQSSGRLTESSQNLLELIKSGNIVLYPDADIRLAVSRAVAKKPRAVGASERRNSAQD